MASPAPDLSRLRIDRDASPVVRRAFRTTLLVALISAGLVASVVLYFKGRSAPAVDVLVVSATAGGSGGASAGTAVTANGYVVARTRAAVSAKLAGRLAELRVSEGSVLKRGDVIARLENAEYDAQVARAEANLATARDQHIEAEAEQQQHEREAQRMRDIRAQQPELLSLQDYEAAASRASQSASRTRAAVSRVRAAEAELRWNRVMLENTLVRAPFNGTVLRKEAEVGEVVAPSVGGGLTRGAVVTMADLSTLEVEVDVNEAYIGRVTNGQTARMTLDAYPDTAFRGQVRQVVPTADRQRATVQVKVSILDHDPRILPEMGARVDFLEPDSTTRAAAVSLPAPRIRVPAAAVHDQNGQTTVWLVRDGRLELRPVQAGPVSAGFREIRSGLAGGELLLVGGIETPKAGMRVEPRTPDP